jgi:hypothetical protein
MRGPMTVAVCLFLLTAGCGDAGQPTGGTTDLDSLAEQGCARLEADVRGDTHETLAEVLEEGLDQGHPHPVLRSAMLSRCEPVLRVADRKGEPARLAERVREQRTAEPEITYTVTGTASTVMVTYVKPGGMEQGTYRVPWEHTIRVKPGEFVSVSAQNQGESGTVTCAILRNRRSISTSTSDGAYAIAMCDGTA